MQAPRTLQISLVATLTAAALVTAGCGGDDDDGGTAARSKPAAAKAVASPYDGIYVLRLTRTNGGLDIDLELGEHRVVIERGTYSVLSPLGPGPSGKVKVQGDVITFGGGSRDCPRAARYRVSAAGKRTRFTPVGDDSCATRQQTLASMPLAKRRSL